jgi:hypothetical protein
MRIKVLGGQTLFDVAIRYYGSIEGVKDLLRRNPNKIDSLEIELDAGVELEIGDPIVNEVVEQFERLSVQPSTGQLMATQDEFDNGVYAPEYDNEYA